ncbi:PAS domain S-box protein [Haloplanus pelagicus]|uniref:PAS domain S-box protein n=1 Tax=Haloplanus pelagicus TaxID=2949995 RepID=UPI0020402E18|nr:PAS domain-containing protein [Haloplanus sp. HW8-1]
MTMTPKAVRGSRNRILPLIADSGNRQVLEKWIDDHPSYESVDFSGDIEDADFDVCIIDKGAFQEHLDALREKKAAAAPVLLPYLLLLPESGADIIESDAGQLADNVVTETIDEIVSLPIQQTELNWRLEALLRLRNQSLTLRERERELERQVDLFEKAQDIANVGAWEYDIDAEEGWWTDEVSRIHALPDDTTPSPELSLQYYHPEDRPIVEDAFETAIEEDEPYDVEVRLTDAEGNQRWVRTRGEPQYQDGELARVRGTMQDITERKERERDLQRIKQAVESAGHAIFITDPDGKIEYVNAGFEETTGFTQAEVVGKTPHVLNSGAMPDGYFEDFWNTILSGEVWAEEIINRRKNGEMYVAMQTVAPVTDGDEIHSFVAVQKDITERKEREETLQRRTQAIDEAPVGITITDPDREDNPMIYVNEAFVDLTGYPREEAVGKNCRFLQGENTDPDRIAKIREAIDSEEPISIEIKNYRKDGTEFWNHLKVAPVRDDAGTVVNYIGFQQDVTGRKERQRQLEVLDRVLRHNLRNDMNMVRGRAETINAETSGEVAASAEEIVDTSDRLIRLADKERQITELLREDPTQDRIEVRDRLQDVVSRVGSEYSDATIAVDCPDDVTVEAMPQFGQAIKELVTNAIIHNDSPSPEVTVTVTQTDETVRIEIADSGPRIPEMDRDLLVDEAEQTPLYHGSGLGLWLVKLITARSGGTITVEENSPAGNVVKIELSR